MNIIGIVLTDILSIAYFASGAMKLAGVRQSVEMRDQLRVNTRLWWVIGALEVLGAIGLLVGLAAPVVGVAAAIGLALLMVGAMAAHGRVKDIGHAAPAALLLISAVVIATVQVRDTV
ncbi:hypothetical protein A5624_10260 [Mycobacterium sp. 1482292.6]|nr:hypothetical protein A5624_10260 [Mycobacterium sp. 1482292.6]OBJ19723.1 hypothetical protein A5622_20440 [Mycobacterium sp. 1245801.1]